MLKLMRMEKKRLIEIIKSGESVELEFKRSLHSVQEIAKLICSFANTQGGLLILGVEDDGKIVGVDEDPDMVQQKASSAIKMVHPHPTANIEVMEIEQKNIVVIRVHKADTCAFHSYDGAIYVRIGSTSPKLEGQAISDFLRNRRILLFEETTDFDVKPEDLDIAKVKNYLEKRGQSDYLETHSVSDFLMNKNMLSTESKVKNVGLLFFAKDSQSFFSYAKIKLVRFDGIEPIKVMAYEEATGNLPEMIDQSVNFVKRFIPVEFVITDIKRKEIPLLPEEASREAIINAVAHRDYFNKNEIQLSVFDDRVEVTNPGGLPEGMTRELLGTLSIQRNPQIYQLLKDLKYMEGIASGIPKIFKKMKEADLEDPQFIFSKEIFRITLRMKKKEEPERVVKWDLNKRQEKGLEFLKKNRKIKSAEYAKMNDISLPIAIKDLSKMQKMGIVKKIGKFKGAHYVLNEEKFK